MLKRRGFVSVSTVLLSVLLTGAVSAEQATSEIAAGPPAIRALQVGQPPVIDGVLDDACWQEASHFEGFWREKVDAPELERTEAWLSCDTRAIYVAFRCHDSQPSEIRANQSKRQGDIHRDDWVSISLDVEDKGVNFYHFSVTPAGTQVDEVPGGTSEKIQWRGDWRGAARTDEGGWTAELAVPFSILRFPAGQQCFRFHLTRHLGRERDESIWPPRRARRQDASECARWTNLVLPAPRLRHVVMPYLLSVASEEKEDRETLTGGLDLKGTFPNGVVALATYQPDFRNIEDVVETIDFTFVERRLPEYRPFFQEGAGFGPSSKLFYSRRVRELDWGAKTFGMMGPHRFSLLEAHRRGGENHLVWNYERLFGTEGVLSFSGADRRVPGDPDNLAFDLGTHWNWPLTGGSRWIGADWYRSHTQGEGGDGTASSIGLGAGRTQGWEWSVDYSRTGSEFQADDGYLPETGVQNLSTWLSYNRSYDEGALRSHSVMMSLDAGESEEGARRNVWMAYSPSLRNGWGAWIEGGQGERDGFDHWTRFIGPSWNSDDVYHKGDIGYEWGEHYNLPYRFFRFNQAFRPTQRWSGQLRFSRIYSADLDDDGNVVPPEWARQMVLTMTYDISEERTLSARLVQQEGEANAYAAYRQRVRKGMDLLVVVGDPNASQWVSRIAVKAMWCL